MKKKVFYYLIVGFILNFMWEIAQFGLYEPHFKGTIDFMMVHLKAAFGDVVMLFIIYIITSLFYWDWRWNEKGTLITHLVVSILGFVCALIVEKYALITGRWTYNDLMPIIPYIRVGLTPILQMMIIAPLSFFLTNLLTGINKERGV